MKETIESIKPTDVIKKITTRASIVGFHQYDKFCNFDEKEVFDFLPSIITKEDHIILRSWMVYFRKLNVPFCITEEPNNTVTKGKTRKRLWKRYE